MFKKLSVYLQYLLPQHLISALFGKLANTQNHQIKSFLIKHFIKRYQVDMTQAEIEDWHQYPNFNSFFTRKLKASARHISPEQQMAICPVDGTVAEIGDIYHGKLLQAKGSYYELTHLLGNNHHLAADFNDGRFATLYLAPRDYHRIHMPIDGRLLQTIFIPGHLFSVNRMTTDLIPNLYTRNERLICIFETEVGKMAVILVGAMIVGSMQVSWMDEPVYSSQIKITDFTDASNVHYLSKGEELGYFKLGSTVILLFEKNTIEWLSSFKSGTEVQFGQNLAKFINERLN